MKKILLTVTVCFFSVLIHAQTVCDPNGNLVIYSNYDGGTLNINVDLNIPDLKIGIVSYEADSINLSGSYVNNVTGVVWAGYNGTNHHCALPVITNTTIHGAPASASTSINILPASPISNPNGYNVIVCNYSCDINSNQGGCNTADQIEAYFLQQFPGSTIYSDYTQYFCWAGEMNISSGGNCCATVSALSVAGLAYPEICAGGCNGSATATAGGGQSPYNYLWNNGATTSTITNLCPGSYTVVVTDNLGSTASGSVTVNQAAPIASTQTLTGCQGYSVTVGTHTYSISGTFTDVLLAANGCDSTVTTILSIIPSPPINNQPLDQTVAYGSTTTFITSSTNLAAFQWQEDTGSGFVDLTNASPYAGVTDDTLVVSPVTLAMNSNMYRCRITDGGCADTTNAAILSVTDQNGIKQINGEQVLIYPNPTDGNLFIKGFVPAKLIVMNKIGQIVFADTNKSVVSMLNYAKGIYFIRLFDENNLPVLTEKVVVQ